MFWNSEKEQQLTFFLLKEKRKEKDVKENKMHRMGKRGRPAVSTRELSLMQTII